eukprot:scaffold47962_cov36-Cyclotella_meneghiniana.AAC.2
MVEAMDRRRCSCHQIFRLASVVSALVTASLVHRYFSSTSVAAFTILPVNEVADGRYSSTKTSLSSSMSSLHPYKVVTHSPVLGGDIIRIRSGPDEEDDSGFLTALNVPTYAVLPRQLQQSSPDEDEPIGNDEDTKPKRLGLEAIIQNSNAFLLTHALSQSTCESILHTCEQLGFGNYQAGKNNHGAMQIVIPKEVAAELLSVIGPHVDLKGVAESELELQKGSKSDSRNPMGQTYSVAGINRRLRVYRYAPGEEESFAPHIDAGFPPGGSSLDDDSAHASPFLLWDASHQYSQEREVVSRLTVLIYLNEDFSGGHTKFCSPRCELDRSSEWNYATESNENAKESSQHFEDNIIASIQPKTGSILVFPQAISEEAVERARYIWPLHEGSPVTSGARPKYVIRTDVLFETNPSKEAGLAQFQSEEQRLFQHDEAVRQVFLPRSPAFSSLFLHHVEALYNPHMGEREGRLRMLDYPFGTPALKDWEMTSSSYIPSSLLCIDNCEHQRETASSAVRVAETLGLDPYLIFLKGDAFDALDTHFSEIESIDLLWCDFGVGSRMKEYASNIWKYIKPGGYLLCHSTLTNRGTREWLEGVRGKAGAAVTGIPSNEYVEMSLLEALSIEHKRYQNSVTLLQKRVAKDGSLYEEPIYSEYA